MLNELVLCQSVCRKKMLFWCDSTKFW